MLNLFTLNHPFMYGFDFTLSLLRKTENLFQAPEVVAITAEIQPDLVYQNRLGPFKMTSDC